MRVGGGCLWGEVDAATQPHGLAVPAGIISTTGVGGLTLGGGTAISPAAHGLTIDNLLAAEIVSPTGRSMTASADEHPDLFWAIRGGGGNFGVVTEFVFRRTRSPTVVGGPTFWAIEDTDELLKAYLEFLPSAPRNASGFFAFHIVPPAPPFPEEIHLRKVCGIVWCIDGTDEEAEQAMAPMLSVAEPLMHGARPDAAAGAEQRVRRPLRPGRPVVLACGLRQRDPRRGDRTQRRVERQHADVEVRVAHLPDRRRRPRRRRPTTHRGPTAIPAGRRSSSASIPIRPPQALRDWTVGYWEALHPYSAGGAYVNFMMDEGQERVKATYGDNYDRLAQVEGEYDPDNVFRVNQNIQPAGS